MILKFDNRDLLENMEVTWLTDTANSGVSSLTVQNNDGWAAGTDYALLENFGIGKAEILPVTGLTGSTTLTLGSTTAFGHTVDTVVTRLSYNQVQFARSTTAGGNLSLLKRMDIEPSGFYTTYEDNSNTTGFGYTRPYNLQVPRFGEWGAYQPYAGYGQNSVKYLRDLAYSNLTDKDRVFVTKDDILNWLNEGFNEVYSALSQVNNEYYLVSKYTLTLVADTATYDLPSDFYDLVKLYAVDSTTDITTVYNETDPNSDLTNNSSTTYFAIFGGTLQIQPTPSTGGTIYMDYVKKPSRASQDDDTFDIPKVDAFLLSDYATMKGKMKSNNFSAAAQWEKRWRDGLSRLIVYAHKRTRSSRSWAINDEQLV